MCRSKFIAFLKYAAIHRPAGEAEPYIQLMKKKVNHILAVLKAGTAAIPFIGGSISSLIGDYFPSLSENRKNESLKNDPNYFPHLNCTSLIKHIKVLVESPNYPYNDLIERIALYQGLDNQRYVLVVEVPKSHPDYLKFMNHWQPGDLRFLVNDTFDEVYHHKTNTDPYINDWFIWVKSNDEELLDDLILKEYYWLLFEKT